MRFFLLVVIRLLGKRTVGHSTAFDFMVVLILGEVVGEPIYGDVPLSPGALNCFLSYRSPAFDRLAGGSPTVLVRDGRIARRALAAERINEEAA